MVLLRLKDKQHEPSRAFRHKARAAAAAAAAGSSSKQQRTYAAAASQQRAVVLQQQRELTEYVCVQTEVPPAGAAHTAMTAVVDGTGVTPVAHTLITAAAAASPRGGQKIEVRR